MEPWTATILLVLRFTSPGVLSDSAMTAGACRDSLHLIPDWQPSITEARCWPLGGGPDSYLVWSHSTPPAGQPDSFTVAVELPATCCVTVRRWNGLESCRACVALGSWPVSVSAVLPSIREERFYDVRGARVTPRASGVYFRVGIDSLGRRVGGTKNLVIIR